MKILLAGPGTGKTTKIKEIIRADFSNNANVLVLSFTNATVNDLRTSLSDLENVKCYTLHSYALKINHLSHLYILNENEKNIALSYCSKLKIEFETFCDIFGCITFNNMITKCIKFIDLNPLYADEKIGNVDLLLVDEFQDFNDTERNLVFLISRYANETLLLGDDDQSIYEFKDADPDGIISVYKDPNIEKLPVLDICYRCPDAVVNYSKKLIENNQHRIDKPWGKSNKVGEVVFAQTKNHNEKHRRLCKTIQLINSNQNKESILILSPVRFYIDDLLKRFEDLNIEYVDFWPEKLPSDIIVQLWWLKSIYLSQKVLFLLFIGKELGWIKKKRFVNSIYSFIKGELKISDLLLKLNDLNLISELFYSYLKDTPDFDDFVNQNPDFAHFSDIVDRDEIEHSILELDKQITVNPKFNPEAVNVMSIHKSKGLQADHVFVIGLNDGIIPREIEGINTLEAWRRLLFVGMTRTRKKLYLISTIEWDGKFVQKSDKKQFNYNYKKNLWDAKTTRFLEEIK